MRFKARLEFDGFNHCGWQSQDPVRESHQQHGTSIQSELQKAILTVFHLPLDLPLHVQGCGRTDAQVSAHEYFCHFDLELQTPPKEIEKIRHGLNGILPESICVTHLDFSDSEFHALDSVKEKTYEYQLLIRRAKPTFERNSVYWISKNPDDVSWSMLAQAVKLFEGTHDFQAFCASGASTATSVRTLNSLEIFRKKVSGNSGEIVTFRFKARGFLRHMVRNITGCLIEVIEEKRDLTSISSLLGKGPSGASRPPSRSQAGLCAPAWGLTLKKVEY